MLVRLMLTCLCDAYFGEVGIATVRVLEHVGCQVEFRKKQTCCGQPPFNSGDWKSARQMVGHLATVFDGEAPIIVPSGSCAAMLHEGLHIMGEPELRAPVYELTEFLGRVIQIKEWPALSSPRTVALHRSCHGRMLKIGNVQESLLAMIGNLTVMPFGDQDQCCGFGGAFSITHGETSKQIGLSKLDQLVKAGVNEVTSGDMGCLMHLEGLAKRERVPLKFSHIAEVLSSAL